MKLLILGASGLLGHKLMQVFSKDFETTGTVRTKNARIEELNPSSHFISGVIAENFDSVSDAVVKQRPDAVINCIGIVKQLPEAKDPIQSIEVNSLFPHRVAALSQEIGARFFHISTDCVFSGTKGDYTEDDVADARDLYGLSKLLGDVTRDGCLTLRTSIIGEHILPGYSLIEWFMKQSGKKVSGYTNAIYTGLPTVCLAEVIREVLLSHPKLSGLYHVSSSPISKFELLELVKKVYSLDVEIARDASLVCDRSLNSERFLAATGIKIPTWPEMIDRMFADGSMYSRPTREVKTF
jgi:dTDP-4-dehydrorhamnose reductase